VGIGMLDEIPVVKKSEIQVTHRTKVVCYTDGLSELKNNEGNDIGTTEIIRHISNTDPLDGNIRDMIKFLGIPDTNPYLFDDVSLICVDLN
jgi:hypothetical protein